MFYTVVMGCAVVVICAWNSFLCLARSRADKGVNSSRVLMCVCLFFEANVEVV